MSESQRPYLADVVRLHVDAQRDLLAAHCLEFALAARQVAGHEGKKVAGLEEGVYPHGVVPG